MGYQKSAQAATPLQAARIELDWTQSTTIRKLREAALDEGTTIASERSLKTMLSRWENGHDQPDPVSQRLLRKVYGRSADELGFTCRGGGPAAPPRLVPAVGPELVGYFRNVFAEQLRADNLMGPHHLVDVVRAQTALLDQMLPNARGEVRSELLSMAFRYNEFAGWLYQDASDPDQALHFTDRSMDYALELGEPRETAYVLMRKADIALDLDKPDRALGLSEAALRNPASVPPRVRALVLRVRGRAHARLGDADACRRALDRAREDVVLPFDAPDNLTAYCTPSYIGMEAAQCWSQLGRFQPAIMTYETALRAWPDPLRRDQGLCLVRLTNAYAGQGDMERACEAGHRALDVVRAAPSSRALSELQRVRVRLAPWRRREGVSDLSDRIRTLLTPAA